MRDRRAGKASQYTGPVETKMIALVVDPAVVGSASVAHVHSHEIPAYQPPPPLVSKEVPESLRALSPGGN